MSDEPEEIEESEPPVDEVESETEVEGEAEAAAISDEMELPPAIGEAEVAVAEVPQVLEYAPPQLPDGPMEADFRAAKWYTISFLVFSGVFSLAGLVAMIWATVWLIGWAMQ